MKVICDTKALLEVVNLAAGVIAPRSPKPQLTCIRFSAKKDGTNTGAGTVTLAAVDEQVALRLATAQVDVQEEGEVLIPADKLRQILAAQEADETLTIESEGDVCRIRGRDAKFKVYGYDAKDFPPVADFPGAEEHADRFTMDAETLGIMITRTIFSTARETSRYAINGVLLSRNGRKIEMVATDGRRLALARGTVQGESEGSEQGAVIVPTKALGLVNRMLNSAGDKVKVAITQTQAIFAMNPEEDGGGALLASKLVEGTFPPYDDVIPRDHDKRATFAVDTLRSAVRRAALLTNEESRGVRMAFGAGEKRLNLSSRAPEMGEANIDVQMDDYSGEDIEIGFNPQFITEALKVIPDERVIIELKSPNKPGLIKSGTDFLYVVMPVNLQ